MLRKTEKEGDINVSRQARSLFRDNKYKEVIDLLKSVERNEYLNSLFTRSGDLLKEKADNLNKNIKKEITVKSKSFFEKIIEEYRERRLMRDKGSEITTETETIKTKRNGSASRKTIEMSPIKKLLFRKKQESKILKSSKLLAETLEKKEILKNIEKDKKKSKEVSEIKKELHDNEIKLAKNVQTNLLPKVSSDLLPGMDSFVYSLGCDELSGDVFDFITSSDYETIFYLGDVTGHGTASSLIMTMISCLTHSIVKRTINIATALTTLNKEIKPKLAKNMFTSMVMCKWNSPLRKFTFAGAGHEFILHYRSETQEVEKIRTGGIAIGMIDDISKLVKEKEILLEDGDILLLYTDGLDEAWDMKKEKLWGVDRIIKDLKDYAELGSAKEIGEFIFNNIRKFQGGSTMTDDMSIMIFKRNVDIDEKNIKNKYIKEQFKKDIQSNEAVLNTTGNVNSQEFKEKKNEILEKTIALAGIYKNEGEPFKALEQAKKALELAPSDDKIKKIYKDIELEILRKEKEGGIKFLFKKASSLFARKIKQKFFGSEDSYIKSLNKEAERAIEYNNILKAERIAEKMKQLDPKNNLTSSVEKNLSQVKKLNIDANALEKFFELKFTNRNEDEEKIKIEDQNMEFEGAFKDFFKRKSEEQEVGNAIGKSRSINSIISGLEKLGSLPKQKENLDEKSEANEEYNSSKFKSFEEKDFLGLMKVIDERSGFKNLDKEDKKIEVLETTMKVEETNIKWLRGSREIKERKTYSKIMAFLSPMNSKDLFIFIEKLSAFVKAGIPIHESVEIIQEQAQNHGFIYVLDELLKALDSGKLLSQAMKNFPEQFSEVLIYLTHAGEKTGSLPVILEELSKRMKEDRTIRKRIKSAMMYPTFIVVATGAILSGLLVFVVPKLSKIYMDTGVELPKVTQIIIVMSDWLQNNWAMFLVGLTITILCLKFFGKTELGQKIYHKLFLNIPIVKNIARQNNVMLFNNNLSILLRNGIQISESLITIAKIVPNYYYKKEILHVRETMISTGKNLTESMGIDLPFNKRKDLFPSEVLQTLSIGEHTGTLAKMLKSTGEMYQEDLKNTVSSLSDLLQPILMVFVGLMVATILMAIMFPLFNLGQVLRKK